MPASSNPDSDAGRHRANDTDRLLRWAEDAYDLWDLPLRPVFRPRGCAVYAGLWAVLTLGLLLWLDVGLGDAALGALGVVMLPTVVARVVSAAGFGVFLLAYLVVSIVRLPVPIGRLLRRGLARW